ncbi:uncharacterized protein PHACADRAFT_145778 [Phanerochaete carnosa HHB-10118-sp]|uniref:BTB domain-containing protein n=1 Tax=Phanerochaete carnosa (strain HHB-10118-sp) TaxID=650164 RepID=K5VRJ9_PHACS|nr:uncharacterized protein PHACADRAFT_145778 [Phanerochaete carnosa HHB-10118-sp]EKM54133.1 hypothetical protein PHACADRAFT_145778 [Phanerochaete carnosa HHB-10118-sp]
MDPNIPILRHAELYYPDGDIVLSAKLETATPLTLVVFRVDKLFLSRHSEVFRGMFEVVSGEKAQESYDGVPVLCMPDRGEDLAMLIEVIYSPVCVYLPPQLAALVVGLADISRKYMVGQIWETIVGKMKSQWPITLELWDARRTYIQAAQDQHEYEHFELFGAMFPEPASAVAFALKHDVPSILPSAFYHLSFTRLDHEYGEFERYEGDRDGVEHLPAARWRLLDAETLRRFLIGKEYLLHNFKMSLDTLLEEASIHSTFQARHPRNQAGMDGKANCRQTMQMMERNLMGVVLNKIDFADIDCLGALEHLKCYVAERGLCDACRVLLTNLLQKRRKEIWERLPAWFNVQQ